ncbi:Bug family tripartite tricarboxylate transporter substrate binding protein [Bradyrhizobium erythrophlei]|uniref:Tripartite-type tricarboxylate transporter, receptor component TctC n=1 Tax=Bradyrhizobium erythrophlei TaxID=1437360 RepID=A0A1M5XWL6_9BRAD|nr:tripartite tricarboxylate transporter substrate binding protein [Bradyrhizobium erythrophlei]SHI03928.1 Tripartite-type tricarboxylate transporter, receptor component TctC [Bradyrhizobium erythrophlei]
MIIDRRVLFAVASIFLASVDGSAATEFPQRAITLVVPFSPGGNVDSTARIAGLSLGTVLKQPIVVLNKPGAGGAIGASYVAKADPDGNTLLITVPDTLTIVPRMMTTSYKMDSFRPVGTVATTTPLLVVRSDSRFKTIQDFLSAAEAKPGSILVAHDGPGSASQLALLQFAKAANRSFNLVPYQGSAPALTDLLGGQVDAAVDQMTSSLSYLKGGQMRALAVMSRDRDPLLPDVPTLEEAGVNLNVMTTLGIYAPAGVPDAIVDTLEQALVKALGNGELQNRMHSIGSNALKSSAKNFREQMLGEDKRAQAMEAAGLLATE